MSKKGNLIFITILSISIIGLFLNYFCIRSYAWEIDRTGTVTYIVDGDTLDVSGVGRIRLADINCPEQGEPGCTAATQYLSSLVYQEKVYIDVDDITGTDPYGRIVAVIYVYYDEDHLKNVNKALLVAGHAIIWDFDNNEFNPYSWTLYVDYQSDPPPDDPTPSDDNSNLFMAVGIGVGVSSFLVVVVIGLYYSIIQSKRPNKKPKEKKKKILLKDRFKEVKREENNIIDDKDPIVNSIISDLLERYSNNIIAIYGIGSYFDESLPLNWMKNDLDIIVVVDSLEQVPKHPTHKTDVRYEKKAIDGYQIWLGFNTLKGYQDRYTFSKQSFSNYEWSLIELKHPENSKLLYGNDIRDQLPSTYKIDFDYNDILARSLYHLDKSFGEKGESVAMKEFSKAIFKAAFYFCVFIDKSYRNTSIIEIGGKIKYLISNYGMLKELNAFLEEAIIFRITGQFKTEFNTLRTNFISYLFWLLEDGSLHEKKNYHKVIDYLTDTFSGFPYLVQEVKKSDLFKDKGIKIADLHLGMRDITITGYIKEIFGTYKFDKEDGTKGKVGSFLLSDSTGDIRVVLWDDKVKYIRYNDFNVGRSLYIVNGYTKQGRNDLGIEIHVSTFGNIYLLPEDQKVKNAKEITKQEVAKRLNFVKDAKSIRIPCPHCGFLCPPTIKLCGKCGEPLPKIN